MEGGKLRVASGVLMEGDGRQKCFYFDELWKNFKCNFLYKMQDIQCDLNMLNALLLYG